MPLFEVAVSETQTAVVTVRAEDPSDAIEDVQIMADNGEIDFEPDGSLDFDVAEIEE